MANKTTDVSCSETKGLNVSDVIIDSDNLPHSILLYMQSSDLTLGSKDLYLEFVGLCSDKKPKWEEWLYMYNTVKRQKFIDRVERAIEVNTSRKEELESIGLLNDEERVEYKNLLGHINNFNKRYNEMTRDQMNDVNRSLDRTAVKRTENINLTGDMSDIVMKATMARDNARKLMKKKETIIDVEVEKNE